MRSMILKKLPGVDSRLNDRYHRLVAEHMNSSDPLSAGLKALPDKVSSFASTQAAWRFYQNESVSLPKLQEPLTAARMKASENIAAFTLYASTTGRI